MIHARQIGANKTKTITPTAPIPAQIPKQNIFACISFSLSLSPLNSLRHVFMLERKYARSKARVVHHALTTCLHSPSSSSLLFPRAHNAAALVPFFESSPAARARRKNVVNLRPREKHRLFLAIEYNAASRRLLCVYVCCSFRANHSAGN